MGGRNRGWQMTVEGCIGLRLNSGWLNMVQSACRRPAGKLFQGLVLSGASGIWTCRLNKGENSDTALSFHSVPSTPQELCKSEQTREAGSHWDSEIIRKPSNSLPAVRGCWHCGETGWNSNFEKSFLRCHRVCSDRGRRGISLNVVDAATASTQRFHPLEEWQGIKQENAALFCFI